MQNAAPGPRPRDAVLVAVLALLAVLEGVMRPDLSWPIPVTVLTLVMVAALPWRRSHPLVVVIGITVVSTAFSVAQAVAGVGPDGLAAMLALIVVPYALFRWASGRTPFIGAGILLAGAAVSVAVGEDGVAGAVAGLAFLGAAGLAGALRRERVAARAREVEIARSLEREALARDLHDTVAHHVTGIAIRAQAAAASPRDEALVAESLAVIEREASAALTEMRSLVNTLRGPADYVPSPGLPELAALATAGPPRVRVQADESAVLPEVVAMTLFRIAQEGITNARRHARGATTIDVDVAVGPAEAAITVRDDGEPARMAAGGGFGIRGMTERATMLGGSLTAGPLTDGGWLLRATLPTGDRR